MSAVVSSCLLSRQSCPVPPPWAAIGTRNDNCRPPPAPSIGIESRPSHSHVPHPLFHRHGRIASVDSGLAQMSQGGLLFSILPYSVMAKSGQSETWRRNLLKEHTLLSVITLPIDIFYPVSAPPVGVVVQKGVPHAPEQPVLWVRAETDGHLKSKGKRLPSSLTTNQLEDCTPIVRAFLDNPDIDVPNRPRFMIAVPIAAADDLLELVPEAYLEQESLTDDDVLAGVDSILRDAAAFLVRNRVKASWDGTG